VIAAFKADIYYIMIIVGVTGVPVVASLVTGKIAFLRQKHSSRRPMSWVCRRT